MLRRGPAVLFATALAGCTSEVSVFIPSTWPSEQVAIIVVVDALDRPIVPIPEIVTAGEPVSLQVPGEPARVLVRTYDPETIADCTIALGGTGEVLPSAVHALATALFDPDTSIALSLEPEEPITHVDLRGIGCTPETTKCDGVETRTLALGVEGQAGGSVFIPGGFVAGVRREGGGTSIVHVTPDFASAREIVLGVSGSVNNLAFDGDQTIFGATGEGELFQLDARDLSTKLVYDIPDSVRRVRAAPDGTVIIFGLTAAHQLVAGSTRTVPLAGFPTGLLDLSIVRPDRMAAIAQTGVYTYDGERWTLGRGPVTASYWTTGNVAGNELAFAAIASEVLLLYHDGTTWLENDPLELGFYDVALLEDQALYIGRLGSSAITSARDFCTFNSGATLDWIETAPGGDHAIAVLDQGDLVAVRFQLPPR